MIDKIDNKLEELEGKTLGVLGLSFKPETDDMRESPALTILPGLIEKGAKIRAYDPEAIKEAIWRLKDYEQDIIYCANEYDVMKGADALVLITEWNQFRRLDLERVKNLLDEPIFFDLRNVYQIEEVKEHGIDYIGVGLPQDKVEVAKKKANVSEKD